jgi:fucose permease
VLTPIIIASLMGINFKWEFIYILLLGIVLIVLFLGVKTQFNLTNYGEENDSVETDKKWDIVVILAAALLFLYVFTEMIFSYWIVEYMVSKGATGGEAKISLSIFWFFIAMGRFITGKLGNKVNTQNLVMYLLILSIISYTALIIFGNIFVMYIFVGLLGMGFSSLYPSIIALGTEKKKNISPGLMTFIMTSGSVGGILYSPISSWVNTNYSLWITMSVGVITTLMMLLISLYIKRKN